MEYFKCFSLLCPNFALGIYLIHHFDSELIDKNLLIWWLTIKSPKSKQQLSYIRKRKCKNNIFFLLFKRVFGCKLIKTPQKATNTAFYNQIRAFEYFNRRKRNWFTVTSVCNRFRPFASWVILIAFVIIC